MNESGGASIEGVQQAICDTGYSHSQKVSEERRDTACRIANGSYVPEEANVWVAGGAVLAIATVLLIVGYLILKKRAKRDNNSKNMNHKTKK